MKYAMLTLSILLFAACSNNEDLSPFLDCDQVKDFKEYNGEQIDCQFHYLLTEYDNQNFIELQAHCADLLKPFVINKNCEDICPTSPFDPNSICSKYLRDRQVLEIVLIKK